MFSAILDIAGVREIGLRSSFRFSIIFFFGKCVTSVNFHILGSRCCLSDALRIVFTGKARHSAYSFRSQLLIPSGPAAFAGLRLDNNIKDLSSDRPLKAMGLEEWAVCILREAQRRPC